MEIEELENLYFIPATREEILYIVMSLRTLNKISVCFGKKPIDGVDAFADRIESVIKKVNQT